MSLDNELLSLLLEEEGIDPSDAPAGARIPRRPDPSVRPLSYSQQRLWMLNQLQPGAAAYNLPVGMRLVGRLTCSR